MKKENWKLIKGVLIISGILYLIRKLTGYKTNQSQPIGIHGLPTQYRIFHYYTCPAGKNRFEKELNKLDHRHIEAAKDALHKAEFSEEFKGKWVKLYINDTITGQLTSGQVRILFYQLDENNYLALSIFLKKDDATDILEKEKARRRINELY